MEIRLNRLNNLARSSLVNTHLLRFVLNQKHKWIKGISGKKNTIIDGLLEIVRDYIVPILSQLQKWSLIPCVRNEQTVPLLVKTSCSRLE